MINGSNDYIIGGVTKIKNYQKEEVSAAASVEEGNKFVITITGGKNGTGTFPSQFSKYRTLQVFCIERISILDLVPPV